MTDRISFTLPQAAEATGLSVETLRKFIKREDGQRLKAKQFGGRYYIKRKELEAWFDGLEDT